MAVAFRPVPLAGPAAALRARAPPRAATVAHGSSSSSSCSSDAPRFAAAGRSLGCALAAVALAASAALSPPPSLAARSDFGVYFVEPADGASVSSPLELRFGVKGLELSPAAAGLKEGTGHHHLLIDAGSVKAGQEIPFDETHLHYGKAQTGAEIALAPGRHRLTLQFANAAHKSYGPGYAASITVNVRK